MPDTSKNKTELKNLFVVSLEEKREFVDFENWVQEQVFLFWGRPPVKFALDFGSYAIKMVSYTESFGRIKLQHAEKIIFSERFDYTETEERRFDLLKEALEKYFLKGQLKENVKISMTLPSSMTFIQRTKLPQIQGKMLDRAVEFEVREKIPIPLSDLIWDYVPLSSSNGNARSVVLAAVRKGPVHEFFKIAADLHLDIERVAVGPAVLYESLRKKISSQEVLVVLDLGAHTTDVIVITTTGFWSRTITFGGYKLTHAVAEAKAVSIEDAEKLIATEGLQGPAKEILQIRLAELERELKRTLNIYSQEIGPGNFTSFLLMGGLARLRGIDDYFSALLNLPLNKKISDPADIFKQEGDSELFFQAASLAQNKRNVINLLPFEEKKYRSKRTFKIFFLFYFTLAAILLLLSALSYEVESAKSKTFEGLLEKKIQQYEGDKRQIKSIDERVGPWIQLLENVRTHAEERDLILRIFSEIDFSFPRPVWLDKFRFDADKREIIVEGKSKEKLVGLERLKGAIERSKLLGNVTVTAGHVEAGGIRRFTCRMELK